MGRDPYGRRTHTHTSLPLEQVNKKKEMKESNLNETSLPRDGIKSWGGRRSSSKEPGAWGSPMQGECLEQHLIPLLCLAAGSCSTSNRTAHSRAYWKEELSYLWPRKEGGKCMASLSIFSSVLQEKRSERKH